MSFSSSHPSRATLLASRRRPSISISPNDKASRMWATSSDVDGRGMVMVTPQRSALVPVGARAHVPGRVERASAERAWWSAGDDQLDASARERAGLRRVDDNTQDRLELAGVLGLQRGLALVVDLDLVLGVMALQDHNPAFGIPSEAHGANPELVLDGGRKGVDVFDSLGICVGRIIACKVVEQVDNPFGECAHLSLLQRHAGQPRPGAGLKEEGPLPGGPHGARNEPVWWVELKDRHTCEFSWCTHWRGSRLRRPPARLR